MLGPAKERTSGLFLYFTSFLHITQQPANKKAVKKGDLSSPWRENPNRRKSVGDESPNGPVRGSFSYIFALVSLRLGIEYICGQSQYLRRLLWLQNSFESTMPRPIAGKKALF